MLIRVCSHSDFVYIVVVFFQPENAVALAVAKQIQTFIKETTILEPRASGGPRGSFLPMGPERHQNGPPVLNLY